MVTTVPDCTLDGSPIPIDSLASLTSAQIARIVGVQAPGGSNEDAAEYDWSFCCLDLESLRCCNEDGDEPDGGWKAAYLRHQENDALAVANGSPEYAGRQEWLAQWAGNTAIYPIFMIEDDDGYRLWDGYHRLAGAFWHDAPQVAVFLGRPKLPET